MEPATLEERIAALEAAQARSQIEREAQAKQLAFASDLVLDLGRRLAVVERHLGEQEELARLRHTELLHALQVAARDTEAKGARLAEGEAGLARAWRLWGVADHGGGDRYQPAQPDRQQRMEVL